MSRKRFGHIPDYPVSLDPASGEFVQQHASSDWLFHDSAIVNATVASTVGDWDYSPLLDEVQDQLGGTCVGQALSSSTYLRAQCVGSPIRRPSATLIVAFAQLADNPRYPIDCDGCRATIAISHMRDRGLVAKEVWPETAENLVTVPPEDVFARAEGATVDAWYRVPSGSDVVDGLKQALARMFLPVFAMSVDTKYENVGSQIYDGAGGQVLGNHAQCIVGYSSARNAFKILNSWGTTFGDGGFAWIGENFMRASTFDRLVVQSTPKEV